MIKFKVGTIIILFLAVTACSRHYVKQSEDSLSFYYNGNGADKVIFYSDINNYAGSHFKKSDGYWIYTLDKPANVEEIKFFYKVNEKVYLPECMMKIKDEFGGKLCILEF
ncbi:glycoside hydrolase family 13 domain protein [Flexistipes sinusarabici DSM 4947]|uniref:Glycoside hydrolase family 13 domain protein n=1 Tax=Flexistipes sinusarabici (strain ATCC 49648 / DSM 4947 / MAS 10) TaxID=717231 RepID=F8E6V3_FLESM|nr:hypothetical protein [Flexistipes sinusarabici]AEI13739.1 glycoside hydrolase family 13 domain protein [Flexistipes sinusarabici DSM 4947]